MFNVASVVTFSLQDAYSASHSCDTVPLKYLVLLPHVRGLVPHGAKARDYSIVSSSTAPFIPRVSPSWDIVSLKYLVLVPHTCSLFPHGARARYYTEIVCDSGPLRYLVFVILVALSL